MQCSGHSSSSPFSLFHLLLNVLWDFQHFFYLLFSCQDIFKEDDDANKEKEIHDSAPAQFAHDAEDSEDWDDHFDTADKDEDTWGSSDAWTYEMNHVGRGEPADWPNKDRLSRQLDGETDEFSLDLRGINLASFSFRTNLR